MREKKTIDSVAKAGLCTGCGTCAGICPNSAISMTVDKRQGVYFPVTDESKCTYCGLCYDVCPGHGVDFVTLNREFLGREPSDPYLGNYLGCYCGHASDPDIRYQCTSGGLVTSLLLSALQTGLIDGALVARMEPDSLEAKPFVARTAADIMSAKGSKYCPVPMNAALREILNTSGSFAVVGLSCHIQGLRKAERLNKDLRRKIVLHLGLACNHAPSLLATQRILSKMGVKSDDVASLTYRGSGWPGRMEIQTRQGRLLDLPFPLYWERGFGHLYCPKRCSLCCDQGNELADVSFADPWKISTTDRIGQTVALSRTPKGESLIRNNPDLRWSWRDIVPEDAGMGFRQGVQINMILNALLRRPVPYYNRNMPRVNCGASIRALTRRTLSELAHSRVMLILFESLLQLRSRLLRTQ